MTETLKKTRSEFGLSLFVIIISGTSASLLIFPPLGIVSYLGFTYGAIIPSIITIFAIGIIFRKKFARLSNGIFAGMVSGAIATFALEAVRIPGYMFLRWIPMDSMISLPGLLVTGKISSLMEVKKVVMSSGIPMHLYHAPLEPFMAGALWHFWNGASFGVIYCIILGRAKWFYGMIFAAAIEMGMMLAPYMVMMKGPFGVNYMDGYNLFVITMAAHLVFGSVLGIMAKKLVKEGGSIATLRHKQG
ncbi:MAG: hypothetical protein KGI27_04805 [Thaumarchaeota archaeon]|nr:hypothetical protein [Nitrososphaerota archaeon]